MWNSGGGWSGWILMTLVMVASWAMVVTAVVLAIRYLAGGGSNHNCVGGRSAPAGSGAEDVPAERYARGEIDDDEYGRRLTLICEER